MHQNSGGHDTSTGLEPPEVWAILSQRMTLGQAAERTEGKDTGMDGVVIYVSKDRSRAIIWCSDHGPLGLARRDAMPPASQPPLIVGELVRFEVIDDAGTRLCGRLTRVDAPRVEGLPDILHSEVRATQRRSHLRLVPPCATPETIAAKAVALGPH